MSQKKKFEKIFTRPINWEILIAATALVVTIYFSQQSIEISQNQTRISLDSAYSQMNRQLRIQREFFEEQKAIDQKNLSRQLQLSNFQLQKQLDQANEQFLKSFQQSRMNSDSNRIQFQKEMKLNRQQYQATLFEINGKAESLRKKNQILSYLEGILLKHFESYNQLYQIIPIELMTQSKNEEHEKVSISSYNASQDFFQCLFLLAQYDFELPRNKQEFSVFRKSRNYFEFLSWVRDTINIRNSHYRDRLLMSSMGEKAHYSTALLDNQRVKYDWHLTQNIKAQEQVELIYPGLFYDSTILERYSDYELIEIFGDQIQLIPELLKLHGSLKLLEFNIQQTEYFDEYRELLRKRTIKVKSYSFFNRGYYYGPALMKNITDHINAYKQMEIEIRKFLQKCEVTEIGTKEKEIGYKF